MALTRKALKEMGLEEETINEIIALHADTVEALKRRGDGYREDASRLQEQLQEADQMLLQRQQTLAQYQMEAEQRSLNDRKRAAYRQLLQDAGLRGEKLLDTILAAQDLSQLELEDGKIRDADIRRADIARQWADYIGTPAVLGAPVASPPEVQPVSAEPRTLTEALRRRYQ